MALESVSMSPAAIFLSGQPSSQGGVAFAQAWQPRQPPRSALVPPELSLASATPSMSSRGFSETKRRKAASTRSAAAAALATAAAVSVARLLHARRSRQKFPATQSLRARGVTCRNAGATFANTVDEDSNKVVDVEEISLSTDVGDWLKLLDMEDKKEAVLSWSEEMGAEELEELVENLEELQEFLAVPIDEGAANNALEQVRSETIEQRARRKLRERFGGLVDPSEEEKLSEDLIQALREWLQEVKLTQLQKAVVGWCEEMGVADMAEVEDNIMDMAKELYNTAPEAEALAEEPSLEKLREVAQRFEFLLPSTPDVAKGVVLFNFDTTIADSSRADTITAWRHAKKLWPRQPWADPNTLGKTPTEFLGPMRQLHKVAQARWELTLLIRILGEAGLGEPENIIAKAGGRTGGYKNFDGVKGEAMTTVELVLTRVMKEWIREGLREKALDSSGFSQQDLAAEAAAMHETWLQNNRDQYLAQHRPFEPTVKALKKMLTRPTSDVYVFTEGPKDIVVDLLKEYRVRLPEDHILTLDGRSRSELLADMRALPKLQNSTFHLVEGELQPLKELEEQLKKEDDRRTGLHLADWSHISDREYKIAHCGMYWIRHLPVSALQVLERRQAPQGEPDA
eukprot:TRINITY_DN81444_c0_g1_i1.p1 TRINITY_DN81444_c0_g1~~TRINITY_DN81444_c0_g1_i1.p1  ORF type:complete len:628 (+),score=192.73 TRINITY_DN81444_c0_g1_i1:61-1944(+)